MAMVPQDRVTMVDDWLKKAETALTTAEEHLTAGRPVQAVVQLYYALFYVVTAGWTMRGDYVIKPTAGQTAFQKEFIQPGLMSEEFTRLVSSLHERWHDGDAVAGKEAAALFKYLAEARELVSIVRQQSMEQMPELRRWGNRDR